MSKIGLVEWAKQHNVSYSSAYRKYKRGEIANAFVEKGDIFVPGVSVSQPQTAQEITRTEKSKFFNTAGRKNKSADTSPDVPFANISSMFAPYYSNSTSSTVNTSNISPQDMVILCQKAYYGVPTIKRVIDTLQFFCTSKIFLRKGNAKSRKFFESYFKAIKLENFQSKFFLEYWRSGSAFIYKIVGDIKKTDLESFQKFAEARVSKVSIPVQYIILNPADIIFNSSAFFSAGLYEKKLNQYEIQRLKNPTTLQEKQIVNALPASALRELEQAKKHGNISITLPLNPDEVIIIFNNKQDYESFPISPIYPVLDDVEHKIQLKKMDQVIAKTCQQAILHVALGYEDKQGNYHYPEEAAEKLKEIFDSEDIGKVLITDFTAKVQFVLPQIKDLLDPQKYEVVDRDIHEGLMDVVFGGGGSGEKFSNLTAKIKIFIEKIKKARQAFLTDFLMPEMEAVSEQMGFKAIPTVEFEEIDLEDNINYYRIIARLGEVGMLTPEEVFAAFNNGKLPDSEESAESQRKFKSLKDDGLYQPLSANIPVEEVAGGRPAGTSSPQSTKSVSPIGTTASIKFNEVQKRLEAKDKCLHNANQYFKEKFSIGELNAEQTLFVKSIVEKLTVNEAATDWENKLSQYLTNGAPEETNKAREVQRYATENNLSVAAAALVYAN